MLKSWMNKHKIQKKVWFLKKLSVCMCLAALSLLCAQHAEAAGKITFCKNFTSDYVPEEPASEFSTTTVSWVASFSEPCGVPQVMFSIYRKDDTNAEEMLHRQNFDVRPEWNLFSVKEMKFPGDGTYILAFNRPDGSNLAEGAVVIKAQVKPEEAAPLPDTIEVEGTTLEVLFNKFKMSAQPTAH